MEAPSRNGKRTLPTIEGPSASMPAPVCGDSASPGSSGDVEVIEAAEGGDVAVLSVAEIGEATASGGGVKRRKIVSSSDVSDAGGPAAKEGADKVALCSSDSTVGQQQLNLGQKNSGCPQPGNKPSILLPTHGVKGPCSRCGLGGHRDSYCGVGLEEEVGGGSAPVFTEDGNVPDMACPCGSGKCLVRTSNTAKNPGRKFYTCPLPLNNGGCYFFKWCDQPNPGPALSLKVSNKYSTPVFKGKSCDLLKWLSDQAAQHSLAVVDKKTDEELSKNSTTQQSNERDNSRCYRCGEEGHWHRDCPNRLPSSSENTTEKPPTSTPSNLCFKCGEEGHWARDCPKKKVSSSTDASSGSNVCFKCRKPGHWARQCLT